MSLCAESVRKPLQLVASSLGLALSLYALYVEVLKEHDPSYKPLCDINEEISCTRVFLSKWGRGMGLLEAFVEHDSALNPRNTFFCIAFYLAIFFLESKAGLGAAKAELYISVFWAAGNVWLAYVLFLVLKDMCVVCISMYVVNATILACSYSRYSDLSSKDGRKKK